MAVYDPVYEQQNQVKKPITYFRQVHPEGEKYYKLQKGVTAHSMTFIFGHPTRYFPWQSIRLIIVCSFLLLHSGLMLWLC